MWNSVPQKGKYLSDSKTNFPPSTSGATAAEMQHFPQTFFETQSSNKYHNPSDTKFQDSVAKGVGDEKHCKHQKEN
jgi:hypothetical protein